VQCADFASAISGEWMYPIRSIRQGLKMWPYRSRPSRVDSPPEKPEDLPDPKEFQVNDIDVYVRLTEKISKRLDWLSFAEDLSRQDVIRALLFQHLYGQAAYRALVRGTPIAGSRTSFPHAYYDKPAVLRKRGAEPVWPQGLVSDVSMSTAREAAGLPADKRGAEPVWPQGPVSDISLSTAREVAELSADITRSTSRGSRMSVEIIGHAESNFKYKVPSRMHTDLMRLSTLEGVPASELVRSILVLQLFGAEFHFDLNAAMKNSSQS
jgi:hypothetical protein